MVDSACALSAASQGVMTTTSAGGWVVDFLTSGLSAEVVRELEAIRRAAVLRAPAQPFQLADCRGHLESCRFPPGP